MNPWLFEPAGAAGPGRRGQRRPSTMPEDDEKGYRIVRTEEAVFAHHPRRRALPLSVRLRPAPARAARVVDRPARSSTAATASSSPTTASRCTITATPRTSRTRSLLAIEQPDARRGEDLQHRRRGGAVGPPGRRARRRARSATELEIVSMPYELAVPARPLLAQPLPTHRVLDLTRVRTDLGYRDVVPAREAVGRDRPLARRAPAASRGGHGGDGAHRPVRLRGRGPLIDAWTAARATVPTVRVRPGAALRARVQRAREAAPGPGPSSRPERPQAATRFAAMELRIGVVYTAKELNLEIDGSAEDVVRRHRQGPGRGRADDLAHRHEGSAGRHPGRQDRLRRDRRGRRQRKSASGASAAGDVADVT